MYFADVPPDEPLGETDCCGINVFNVYSVAVQIKRNMYILYKATRFLHTKREREQQRA